jgi:hypothetical protein
MDVPRRRGLQRHQQGSAPDGLIMSGDPTQAPPLLAACGAARRRRAAPRAHTGTGIACTHTARPHSALARRITQSFAPTLHSCFLERSRQQEATHSFAYCSLCSVYDD